MRRLVLPKVLTKFVEARSDSALVGKLRAIAQLKPFEADVPKRRFMVGRVVLASLLAVVVVRRLVAVVAVVPKRLVVLLDGLLV